MKEINKNAPIRCVRLKGDLSDWGNHVFMPNGITLCGMPTVDTDKELFPILKNDVFKDMIFEYTEQQWNITCKRCIDMFDIVDKAVRRA